MIMLNISDELAEALDQSWRDESAFWAAMIAVWAQEVEDAILGRTEPCQRRSH